MVIFNAFRILILVVVLSASTMLGQISASTGAIQGTATDSSGALMSGATVTLTNTSTGIVEAAVKTKSNGGFVFPLLVPGNYEIQVQAQGFNSSRIQGIVVEVTKVSVIKASLEVGKVTSEVTVSATAQMVDTTTATTGDVENAEQIRSTPLPTRNFLNLTTLQAGVDATMQSAAVVGAGAPVIEVAGQRSISNNYVLDGVDANNFGSNSLSSAAVPNPDAVEEFRVNTSMYDASQGRSSGGNINAIIRSGTDKFHGSLFEFNRNTDYNANDFFFNQNHAQRPVLLQNQFGGTIGGPIPKLGETFWFFSYQGTRQVNGVSSAVTGSQPVLPARNGMSAAQYTASVAAAFNIPAANLDPVAINLLLAPGQYGGYLFASANGTPGTIGTGAISIPTKYSANQYVTSADRQVTKKNHVSVKYFTSLSTQAVPTGGTTLGQGQTAPANNYHLGVSDSQVVTPNLVNQFDTGYTYLRSATTPNPNGVTNDSVGITKFDSGFGFVEGESIPNFTFTSGSTAQSFGGSNTNGSVHGGTASITANDVLSYSFGSHTIRTGFQFTRYQWNYENDYGATGAIGFPNFNAFLTGSPQSLFVSTGLHYNEFRAFNAAGFIQDDYRVLRKLMLNIGVRYDYVGWPHDDLGRIGNYDQSRVAAGCVAGGGGACMQAGFFAPSYAPKVGTPGVSGSTLTSLTYPIAVPRIGFAYDVLGNGRLAVRGGFGVFNITDSAIPILQLNAGPPVLDLYNVSVPASPTNVKQLANPWPAGLLLPSAYPAIPPFGQFQGTFSSTGTPLFLDGNGNSVPLVGTNSMVRNLIHSYNEQWGLNVEYSPWKDYVVQVGYIGSRGLHLMDNNKTNLAVLASPQNPITYTYTPPGGGAPVTTTITTNSAANANLRVPEIGISAGGNSQLQNFGYSYYDGLTVELRHSFSQTFRANVDYTFSRSIDDSSAIGGFSVNPAVPNLSKGVSDFNEPNRLVATYTWALPGPKSGWRGEVLGGWQTTGVFIIQTGLPLSVTSTTGGSLEGVTGTGEANVATCVGPRVFPGSAYANRTKYLNNTCWAAVPVLAKGTIVTGINDLQGPGSGSFPVGPTGPGDPGTGSLLGNSSRNIVHGPTDSDLDMAVMKDFPIHSLGERTNLQFRAEAFKLFNNVNFSNPSGSINSATFGAITSTLDTTGRILQLAAKLSF
jgi:hypothetical protein